MSKLTKRDLIFSQFLGHLAFLGVSQNTLKNYSSDISTFEVWIKARVAEAGISAESLKDCIPFLSPEIASEFKDFLAQKHQKLAVNRRLASLRALSRFLTESQIMEFDFMDGVSNLGTQTSVLAKHPVIADFRKHLESENVSGNTIKNYLSDVKHFLSWLETNH